MMSRLFYLTWFRSQNTDFNLKSFKETLWKILWKKAVRGLKKIMLNMWNWFIAWVNVIYHGKIL